jgi:hypothetical protein
MTMTKKATTPNIAKGNPNIEFEKEIRSLIQVANAFNEISDDSKAFDRVFKYIEQRYIDAQEQRIDDGYRVAFFPLSEACSKAEAGLDQLRQHIARTDDLDKESLISYIDAILLSMKAGFTEKVTDLPAYKMYKKITMKAG